MPPAITKTCPTCGKQFKTFPSMDAKFCCKACANAGQKKAAARPAVCQQCGKTFSIKSGHADQKFCCRACYNKKHPHGRGEDLR